MEAQNSSESGVRLGRREQLLLTGATWFVEKAVAPVARRILGPAKPRNNMEALAADTRLPAQNNYATAEMYKIAREADAPTTAEDLEAAFADRVSSETSLTQAKARFIARLDGPRSVINNR